MIHLRYFKKLKCLFVVFLEYVAQPILTLKKRGMYKTSHLFRTDDVMYHVMCAPVFYSEAVFF